MQPLKLTEQLLVAICSDNGLGGGSPDRKLRAACEAAVVLTKMVPLRVQATTRSTFSLLMEELGVHGLTSSTHRQHQYHR